MTKLLEEAVEVARALPSNLQDEIAHLMLRLAGDHDDDVVALSASEREAIAVSRDAARRGEYASDSEVKAVWSKHNL